MDAEGESATHMLSNQVLLMIFRYLDLLVAEQAIVNTCFATMRKLDLSHSSLKEYGRGMKALKMIKRCGPALKSLRLYECDVKEDDIDWIAEFVKAFPRLLSISLIRIPIRSESLRVLPVKCSRLTKIILHGFDVTDEDLKIVLKGFPALKCLKLSGWLKDRIGECFRELGSNVEHLRLTCVEISAAGCLQILSRCTNLQKLEIHHKFNCKAYDFSKFCKKAPLRELVLNGLQLSKEVFLPISRLFLLEQLYLINCLTVDSDVLIKISHGCPNLKLVYLSGLQSACDCGVKSFARCQHLTHFYCSFIETVTDESLFEIAKAGVLETLEIYECGISDRGVSAILAQCPHLEYLFVSECSGVGDSTVDAAIEAVESRARHADASDNHQSRGRGKRTVYVSKYNIVELGDYLLWFIISGEALNRYKDGLSHPLLYLDVDVD